MRVVVFLVLIMAAGCEKESLRLSALVPEYFDPLDFSDISSLGPQDVVEKGSILQKDNFLFVNEYQKGIHVIDNKIPGSPLYMHFWNIPGNSTFTMDDTYLYADNGPHLLVINILDFGNIKFERYIEGVFLENMREQFPREASSGQLFVCPDPELGLVKSWREEIVEKPNCEKI